MIPAIAPAHARPAASSRYGSSSISAMPARHPAARRVPGDHCAVWACGSRHAAFNRSRGAAVDRAGQNAAATRNLQRSARTTSPGTMPDQPASLEVLVMSLSRAPRPGRIVGLYRLLTLSTFLMLVALTLNGCAGLFGADPLRVSVAGIEPIASQGLEIRFNVKLRVQNPND